MTVGEFHTNPDSGKTSKCPATQKCRFSDSESGGFHASTADESQRLYQESIASIPSHEVAATVKSKSRSKSEKRQVQEFLRRNDLTEEAELNERILSTAMSEQRPLTNREFRAHERYVDKVTSLMVAQGFTSDEMHSDGYIGDAPVWSTEREAKHREIMDEYMDENRNVLCESKVLFAGGLGGAGKSSTISEHNLIDRKSYATVNPDDLKEVMARKGMIPKIPGTLPMEVSTVIHEEASMLSKRIKSKLISERKNVLMDVTIGSLRSASKSIKEFKSKGYQVDAFFVHIDQETSKSRGAYRYQTGLNQTLMRGEGIGERPLPTHLVDAQKPVNPAMKSLNAENLVALHQAKMFDSEPRVFNNSGSGPVPVDYPEFSKPVKR